MAKKSEWCAEKIMKSLAKVAKFEKRPLLMERVPNEIFGEIVYLTDGCACFPIIATEYDALADKCNCPKEQNINKSIYDMIKTMYNESDEAKATNFYYQTRHGRVVTIYETKKEYTLVDVRYTDIIDYLPTALRGYAVHSNDIKTPVSCYNENCDLGYVILPIHDRYRTMDDELKSLCYKLNF